MPRNVSRAAMVLLMAASVASLAQTPPEREPSQSRSEQPAPPLTATAQPAPPQPAAPPPATPPPATVPRVESDLISEALCGGHNKHHARAKALDAVEIAEIWRQAKISDVESWLRAPRCRTNKTIDLARYHRRIESLRQIQSKLEQVPRSRRIETELKQVRDWKQITVAWPERCKSCAELHQAMKTVLTTSNAWPRPKPGQEDQVGWWLDSEKSRRSLMGALCKAKPRLSARTDFGKKFAFYSWTTSGQTLLKAAAWFEQNDVVKECTGQ